MILKLPIIHDNKIILTNFRLVKVNSHFMLYKYNLDIITENELVKIILCNNINGYDIINIYFPLKLFIIDNLLINVYFFFINILSNNINQLDFFYNLNEIMSNKYNLKLINIEHYINYQEHIVKFINSEYLELNKNKDIKNIWEIINLIINASGFNIWNETSPFYLNEKDGIILKENQHFFSKILKKIIKISNNLKNINYSIDYSNNYNINEHINNINNIPLNINEIKPNKNYFLLINNNKILLVNIININKNIIKINNINNYIEFSKYKWYNYSPEIKISKFKIFANLLNNDDIYKLVLTKTNIINNSIDSNNDELAFKT
jgi:hypothetical protein